jgi:thymidylate synthase
MNKHSIYKTFQEAFLGNIEKIINQPEFKTTSRIGNVYEISSMTYEVEEISSFVFKNESIGRLTYDYADTFYRWMMNGCTDSEEILDKYPNISKFMEKPKSKDLPKNFNTFYGPRILEQLPLVKEELIRNSDTRRAVISIIYKEDLLLLDKDESLEFPCTDSATFFIRDGKLNCHLHMRSQNMGQVIKLDMYLWGRFTCELAKELNLDPGKFSCSIVSAHVFEKDLEYLESLFPDTTLGNVYSQQV